MAGIIQGERIRQDGSAYGVLKPAEPQDGIGAGQEQRADEEVLELEHVWIEAVEAEQLLLELQPRGNRICLEKPWRAQRMRREEDRRVSRHLDQIAKRRGYTDSALRIDDVMIVSTKQ